MPSGPVASFVQLHFMCENVILDGGDKVIRSFDGGS